MSLFNQFCFTSLAAVSEGKVVVDMARSGQCRSSTDSIRAMQIP